MIVCCFSKLVAMDALKTVESVSEFVPRGSVSIEDRLITINIPDDQGLPGLSLRTFWAEYAEGCFSALGREGEFRIRMCCKGVCYPEFWLQDYLYNSRNHIRSLTLA